MLTILCSVRKIQLSFNEDFIISLNNLSKQKFVYTQNFMERYLFTCIYNSFAFLSSIVYMYPVQCDKWPIFGVLFYIYPQ